MKKGDTVKVVKKVTQIEGDFWVDGMDKYVGLTLKVKEVKKNKVELEPAFDDCVGYNFPKEALKLVK